MLELSFPAYLSLFNPWYKHKITISHTQI